MMNKAEKRELEIETLVTIYNFCDKQMEYHKEDIKCYEIRMKETLEQDPDYDCSYYLQQIEQNKVHVEAYKKAQETIYKMM